jgi:hypothetical protein
MYKLTTRRNSNWVGNEEKGKMFVWQEVSGGGEGWQRKGTRKGKRHEEVKRARGNRKQGARGGHK